MAFRNIIKVGDPILNKISKPVDKFDERLHLLLEDMKETMYKENGAGLAAVQVGFLRRAFIADIGDGLLELVNPEIIESNGVQEEKEGCLSLPGQCGITSRPATVKVKAQNRHGKWFIYKAEGLKARCFCHEIDHLNGVLFTQKVIRMIDDGENEE